MIQIRRKMLFRHAASQLVSGNPGVTPRCYGDTPRIAGVHIISLLKRGAHFFVPSGEQI